MSRVNRLDHGQRMVNILRQESSPSRPDGWQTP